MAMEKRDDTWYLSGPLDESVDFRTLLAEEPPLRLNLGGAVTLSSYGIRTFVQFVRQWGERELEIHECPRFFVESVNTFPALIGGAKKVHRMASFYAPFTCPACRASGELLLTLAEVTVGRDGIRLAAQTCRRCGQAVRFNGDADDYFLFAAYR